MLWMEMKTVPASSGFGAAPIGFAQDVAPQDFSPVESTCTVSMGSVKITWSSVVFFFRDARHPPQLEHLDFVECPGYNLGSS